MSPTRETLTTALVSPFRVVGEQLHGQAADTAHLIFRATLVLLILVAFTLRLPLLNVYEINEDDFQHLHSAYSIYQGMLPYRDFFDHHTPWLHFILQWIFLIWGQDIPTIFIARKLMLVFTGGLLYVTYRLGKEIHSTDAGLIGALFLSYTQIFFVKTMDIRPDTPAVALWLLALLCVVKGIRRQRSCWYAFGGLAMGSSIMFTQKSLFALAGLGVALLWSFVDPRGRIAFRRNVRMTGAFVAGLALPIVVTSLYFLANRALYEFINCTFLMNFRWEREVSPYGFIVYHARQNPFILAIQVGGLLLATLRLRRQFVLRGEFAPVLATYVLIVGLFLIPVPYPQYFLFFLPMLAIFAAILIMECADTLNKVALKWRCQDARQRWWLLPAAVYLVGTALGMYWTIRHSYLTSAALLLGIACIGLAIVFSPLGLRYAVLVLICGTLVQPFNQMLNAFSQGNKWVLGQVRYILDHSETNDTVLDGFGGYGVFRPHAYFYFFLHRGMLKMLNAKQRGQDVIDALERQQTKFINYDRFIRSLNPEVQTYIQAHYRPVGVGEIHERIGAATRFLGKN
jgi:4-amino-4-deoxy-L-arabinose transferase-like glycosyltransferase